VIGAVRVEAIRLKRASIAKESEMLAPIARSTKLAIAVIRKTTMITPKTCQPLPLTRARERPKASIAPLCSTTITGAITDQMVSRIRPGTMIKARPIAMPIPARMPAPISGRITGQVSSTRSLTEESRVPSWTSRTRLTTMPW